MEAPRAKSPLCIFMLSLLLTHTFQKLGGGEWELGSSWDSPALGYVLFTGDSPFRECDLF